MSEPTSIFDTITEDFATQLAAHSDRKVFIGWPATPVKDTILLLPSENRWLDYESGGFNAPKMFLRLLPLIPTTDPRIAQGRLAELLQTLSTLHTKTLETTGARCPGIASAGAPGTLSMAKGSFMTTEIELLPITVDLRRITQ